MEVYPDKRINARFGEILAELDALAAACDGDAAEELEDRNAELEDALLLLSELKPGDDDWREERDGALEDIQALASDYRALIADVPGLEEILQRLEDVAKDALQGL